MKMIKLSLIPVFSVCLLSPITSQAGDYEDAVQQATTLIDKARAANYEWRDSRKMLKQADDLYKSGKKNEAMKLVATAQRQGELAFAQSEQQARVTGPHK